MITGETRVHSLFGSPIDHSLSRVIFNTTFQKLSLNRTYLPFDVGLNDLKNAVEAARTLAFEGFNVTMPYKTRILELLDRFDDTAEKVGAVNTVAKAGKKLVGYSTDGEGALRAIKSYGFNPEDKHILVIGAGGAARAVVQRLSTRNNSVKILNRTLDRARRVAENPNSRGRISYAKLTRKNLEASLPRANLLVNTTPLQTTEILSQLAISLGSLKDIDWIFDLAYDKFSEPVPTRPGRISPLEMLVHQAALSYEIWLRKPAPFSLMRSALTDHLGRDWK
ncbi:MAG TPA: shikimate dehydrogenase [Candidatus Bathyarchaeia archaeon]|nr:shikimate dehydrogenase [Candidatus Bathyarchaeia archaeon]